LKDADIERIIAEAEMQRKNDESRKELAEARVQAESLIYTSQKAVDEYGSAVFRQDLEVIRADIAELQMRIQGTDIEQINDARVRLEESAYRIAEAMYAGVGPAADGNDASPADAVSSAIAESIDPKENN
jgi:molecular chaperone DnaK